MCNSPIRKFKILHTPCPIPEFSPVGYGFRYDPRANVYRCVKIFGSIFLYPLELRFTLWELTLGERLFDQNNIVFFIIMGHTAKVLLAIGWIWQKDRPEILSFDFPR